MKESSSNGVWDAIKPFVIGSLSGMMATCVIQPIDTVKVVIQVKNEAAGKTKVNLSPFAVARQVIGTDGIKGLYAGLDAAVMRQLIYAGARLGIYKKFQDDAKARHKRNLTFGEKVIYSLFSGALGSVIANPTDVALIRFQSDNNLPQDQRRNYKNIFDALRRITAEQGITGLWRGSVPTVFRAMSVNCSQLVSYNQIKEIAMKFTKEQKETMPIRLVSSAFSGISVALFSLPFDNVKTKIMKMKKGPDGTLPYSGFFNCFKKSIAHEGVTGLWVGLPTYYFRIAPHAMITVLAQDFLHDIFSKGKH